ncbi:MAG TPA: ATP-binding protein [Myxococcota bacterium]|nr:ATP-binding protein [Myxococcota bacterium]
MNRYEIMVCTGLRAGASVRVPGAGLVVGRTEQAGLVLPDPEVSAQHARLRPAENGLDVDDLGSRNGTFVAGARVRQARLKVGDVVVFGSTLVEVRAARGAGRAGDAPDERTNTALMQGAPVLGHVVAAGVAESRRADVLASLYHLGVAVTAAEEPARLLAHGRQLLRDALGAEVVAAAHRDHDGDLVLGPRDESTEDLSGAAAQTAPSVVRGSHGRVMQVPLVHAGRSVGAMILRLDGRAPPFDQAARGVAESLAAHVAAGLAAVAERRAFQHSKRELEAELDTQARALGRARKTLRIVEKRVVEAERMAAVAQLAEAVAHEVNNPLSFLLASLEAMRPRECAHAEPDDAELLADCREGARRIQAVVQKLQVLWNGGRGERTRVDLQELVSETLRTMRRELEERVQVEAVLGAAGAKVLGSAPDLVQALRNLLANVRQAAEEVQEGRIWVLVRPEAAGAGVEVVVGGTGAAVPPALRAQLFEPFGKGGVADATGLGLWMSRQIVADHGGAIRYEDAPGRGAQFVVTLPYA